MKRYPAYKDLGVEWTADIPHKWDIKRLKFVAKINPSRPKEVSAELPCVFIPMESMNTDGTFDSSTSKPFSELKTGFTYFAQNDVIFAKITPCFENGKGALLSNLGSEIGFGSTEFHVLRAMRDRTIPGFLYYLTISGVFRRVGEAFMQGVAGQKRVTNDFVEDFVVGVPSINEQACIVTYLNRKTAQIDDLIAKKERMIQLLKEERTAIINQAVTKGLDSKAEMKDSGIEWLGKIPKHWEIKKIKFNTYVRFSNVDKKSEEGEIAVCLCNYVDVYYNDFITLNLEFMTATASIEEIRKFQLNIGDVIVTKDSESWDDIAIPAYVLETEDKLICGYHLAQIRSDSRVLNGKFLFWMLSGNSFNYQFKIEATGITRYGLSNYGLSNSLIVLPPVEEQDKISKYLEQKTKQLAGQIEREQKSIELLKEYRAALISEVVTGKIDVRECVA